MAGFGKYYFTLLYGPFGYVRMILFDISQSNWSHWNSIGMVVQHKIVIFFLVGSFLQDLFEIKFLPLKYGVIQSLTWSSCSPRDSMKININVLIFGKPGQVLVESSEMKHDQFMDFSLNQLAMLTLLLQFFLAIRKGFLILLLHLSLKMSFSNENFRC